MLARPLLRPMGMTRTWLAMAALALAGCDLYFNGGDDAPCAYGTTEVEYAQYRDPQNATCIGGGGGYCDDKCGPCPASPEAAPDTDMGQCYSSCTGLDQDTCQATSGCYAAFVNESDRQRRFEGCWQTAPSAPTEGSCAGFDARECSRHDDCGLVYSTNYNGTMAFDACISEPGQLCLNDDACGVGSRCDMTECHSGCDSNGVCTEVCYGVCVPVSPSCAATDCGPGYHCEEQCYPNDKPGPEMGGCTAACVPDVASCSLIDCGPGYECIESCELSGNGTLWCGATCAPVSGGPGSCYGQVACDALPPACPTGTTPGRSNACWTGYCIPNAACGPSDPGECYVQVACDALPPSCPSGTTAGVTNGCWSGFCIPTSECAPAACETLDTESACTDRYDCMPVYTGTNCTCYPNGCSCETLSYDRCESWYMAL
jgi:hypothetical protein